MPKYRRPVPVPHGGLIRNSCSLQSPAQPPISLIAKLLHAIYQAIEPRSRRIIGRNVREEFAPSGKIDQPLGNLAEGERLIAIRESQSPRLAAVGVCALGARTTSDSRSRPILLRHASEAIMVLTLRTENANGQHAE